MLIRLFMVVMLVVGVAVPSVSVGAGPDGDLQRDTRPGISGRLPDILVESMNFNAQPSGKMVTLTITGMLYNSSTEDSWCCPTDAGRTAWAANASHRLQFRWKKYVRNLPLGVWTEIGVGVMTMLKAHERQSFNFTDSLPQSAEREYKIVLDTDQWLKESNKDNNTKTAAYPGRR